MTEDNIESLWRKTMNSSADNCPMDFAMALAKRAAEAEREACAKLIDSHPQAQLATQYDWTRRIGQDLAAAILARYNLK